MKPLAYKEKIRTEAMLINWKKGIVNPTEIFEGKCTSDKLNDIRKMEFQLFEFIEQEQNEISDTVKHSLNRKIASLQSEYSRIHI